MVAQYESALDARDAETICRELLAPSRIDEFFGTLQRCEPRYSALMERPRFTEGPPSGNVASIEIERNSATANLDRGFYELSKERGRWYIHLIS